MIKVANISLFIYNDHRDYIQIVTTHLDLVTTRQDLVATRHMPSHLFGIHFQGTELLDSPVRMKFSTGLFQVVVIWLSMEFSSGHGVQQVCCHSHCDITATLTSLQ